MKNKQSKKIGIIFCLTILLFISTITPIITGYKIVTISNNEKLNIGKNSFYRFHDSEIAGYGPIPGYKCNNFIDIKSEKANILKGTSKPLDGPMDSPWPMYCHDTRHTGRSPYSTVHNYGYELWNMATDGWAEGGPTIDKEGTIYIGAYYLYAVYPNGTLKWKYHTIFSIVSAPAIDKNGTIYFGTIYGNPSYLYAVYPNGTLKWKWSAGSVFGSPTIGNDGTIYFGGDNHYINALYPNGTLKWRYQTGHVVYSSPAIGQDGIVYCGSHDTYLYALYPNNGTLKWKYKTGDWIRTSPCVADDGTIYAVSLDSYLYALYPNGTLKWKTNVGAGTSPTIGQEGTIYCGYNKLYAIYPTNGSVKWVFNPGSGMSIEGGTPCNSADGTIYFGTSDGGEIIAVNPNGAENWRRWIGTCDSPPSIGNDGTVYIGSDSRGLHAFGIGELQADADGPHYGLINQPVQFSGSATGGYRPYSWLWNFGDGQTSNLQNPTHSYVNPGNYTVTLTVTDDSDNTSSDTTWAKIKESNNPPNKPSISGQTNGETGTMYYYTFVSTDPDNDEYLHYYIDWGDGSNSGWKGPYVPGEDAGWGHAWDFRGTYIIKAKARDNYGGESEWGTLSVTMPLDLQISQSFSQQINQQSSNQLFLKMLQRVLLRKNLFL